MQHGNIDLKGGFFVNTKLIEGHVTNVDECTLEALGIIKDYLIQVGGPGHVRITRKCWNLVKSLVRSVKYISLLKIKKRSKKRRNLKSGGSSFKTGT